MQTYDYSRCSTSIRDCFAQREREIETLEFENAFCREFMKLAAQLNQFRQALGDRTQIPTLHFAERALLVFENQARVTTSHLQRTGELMSDVGNPMRLDRAQHFTSVDGGVRQAYDTREENG